MFCTRRSRRSANDASNAVWICWFFDWSSSSGVPSSSRTDSLFDETASASEFIDSLWTFSYSDFSSSIIPIIFECFGELCFCFCDRISRVGLYDFFRGFMEADPDVLVLATSLGRPLGLVSTFSIDFTACFFTVMPSCVGWSAFSFLGYLATLTVFLSFFVKVNALLLVFVSSLFVVFFPRDPNGLPRFF